MSASKNAAFIPVLFLFWLGCAVAQAVEGPKPEETGESQTLRFLISGELGGLWEGKNPIQPRGGLGNRQRGLLGALEKANIDSRTIPILMGNNLGRVVKADSQTSTSGFHGRLQGEQANILSHSPLPLPPLPADKGTELKEAWKIRYQEAGLHFRRCERYIDDAGQSEEELRKASLECDRELFIWQIEQNFRAVALGPGDFNDLSTDWHKKLAELRHYPFVASNIFVVSERQYGCRGEDCNQAKPFEFAKEIFPSDPFVLELPDGGFSQIVEIELVESKEPGQPPNPFHSRRIVFKRGEEVASSTFEHIYRLSSDTGVQHAVRYGAGGLAKVSNRKLSWTWPTPLWPNTTYKLVVRWKKGPTSLCFVNTHELFTVANPTDRPRGSSVPTLLPGPTLLEDRETMLRSQTAGGQPLPWFHPGVPVIDASLISGLETDVPLRILAVLDEKYQATLDKAPEDQGGGVPIVNQIRLMPMKTAVEYWRKLMELIETPDALRKLQEAVATNGTVPAYAAFKALRNNEKSGWEEDNTWKVEKAAWKCLEDFGAGRVNQDCKIPGAADSPLFDLRPESLREAVSGFQTPYTVVLLAHAEKKRVRELADKLTDLAMIVGQPAYESMGPKGQAVVQSPYEPLQVYPKEFAGTLDKVELTFVKQSPWRVAQTSQVRESVLGSPLELLFAGPGPNLQECCNPELTLLAKRAVVNKNVPLSAEAAKKDREHLRGWLKLRMRELAKAETAYIQQGVVDPEVLDWIRALRLIVDGKRIDVQEASIEELAQVPGIDEPLAREIKAYRDAAGQPIRKLAQLETYWKQHLKNRDPDLAAWSWVRWFIQDTSGGPARNPYVNHPVFIDQFFRRLALVNYHLWKVVMSEDQLKKLRSEVKEMEGIEEQGLDVAKKEAKLHFEELGGKRPVTVALMSNLVSEDGPFTVLKEETILRERISQNGKTVTLQKIVRELTDKDGSPQDPEPDWVAKEIQERDDRGAWTVSLNAAGLTFQDVATAQGFRAEGVNDERTETKEERRVGVKPELVLAYRGARLDWTNTLKTNYETNRLGPNALPNPLSDSWTMRSEMDFFWRERGKINFPLYTSASLESQWRRRLQVVGFKNFDDSLTFPLPKRKELLSEYGLAVANEKKSNIFRFGFTFGRDFDRVVSATVQHPNAAVDPITGDLDEVNTQIQALACPNDSSGNGMPPDSAPEMETCFRPTTPIRVSLERENRLTYGLAFRGQYEVEFWELAGGRKIKFTSKLTDGNFFFRREGDLPGQPRFRFLLSNEVTFPLFGNLSFVPGLEVFVFRTKGGDPSVQAEAPQTFWSRKPFFRLDYTFDLKPAFMRLVDGLRFRNK